MKSVVTPLRNLGAAQPMRCVWSGLRKPAYSGTPKRHLPVRLAPNCRRFALAALIALPMLSNGTSAWAQNASTIVTPVIEPDYSRDRNVSVSEQRNLDYEAIGIRVGSFIAAPSLEIAPGATDNVFFNNANKISDTFVLFRPAIQIKSDWAQNRVILNATGNLSRYAKQTLRNENSYFLNGLGSFDVSDSIAVEGQVQLSHVSESPYTDDVTLDVSVLSQYSFSSAQFKVIRKVGRTRMTASVRRDSYDFNTLDFGDGTSRNQDERNRDINRLAILGEYALSPSLSVYGQLSYDDTNFTSLRLNGSANRDSKAFRLIGGVNFDLAGLMRGTIGAGYTRRNYRSGIYRDVGGLSLQAQLEFFLSPLTTASVNAQRLLQDATLGNGGAYRDTRVTGKIDHALLRNLILTASGTYARERLFENDVANTLFFGEKFQGFISRIVQSASAPTCGMGESGLMAARLAYRLMNCADRFGCVSRVKVDYATRTARPSSSL